MSSQTLQNNYIKMNFQNSSRMHLNVDEKSIIWPGRQSIKPEGFMIPTHLKVLTIEEKPFVYVRKLEKFPETCGEDEISCPHFNSTDERKPSIYFNHC